MMENENLQIDSDILTSKFLIAQVSAQFKIWLHQVLSDGKLTYMQPRPVLKSSCVYSLQKSTSRETFYVDVTARPSCLSKWNLQQSEGTRETPGQAGREMTLLLLYSQISILPPREIKVTDRHHDRGVKKRDTKNQKQHIATRTGAGDGDESSSNSSNSDQMMIPLPFQTIWATYCKRKSEMRVMKTKLMELGNNPPPPPPPKDNGSNFKGNKINPRSGRRKTMMESTIVTWT